MCAVDASMEPVVKVNAGATKWHIRQKVWDYIEENNLANFPRPVHNRIPNFKGAFTACDRVPELQVFTQTTEVKVDPDKPLEGARLLVLQARKTLLVPTPRLRTGLFNKITPPQGASKEQLRICSTSQGVKEFSVPVGLDAKVKVDLVVVGSVAVSEKGFRIGKGEGYADIEYGMMASMGAVNESTVVVTVVHDCQVVDIPQELIESHDLTVDYILTPTRVIKTNCQLLKPQGIIWTKLDSTKLKKIPILKKLRAAEEQAGKNVTLGDLPAMVELSLQTGQTQTHARRSQNTQWGAERESRVVESEQKAKKHPASLKRGQGATGKNGVSTPEDRGSEVTTSVYLGGIPVGLRVSDLKAALREREAAPMRLTWQGAQHRAFLEYCDRLAAERALEALQGLCVKGHNLQAELARSRWGAKRSQLADVGRSAPPKSTTARSGTQGEAD
ncbi:methenyltetrahydrofolate synthase domain-containing protein isoform X1 [Thalassophryne amazonica]|uniref:methenyltetrahydrofolate synthase domain-containing protein isoform X1 n=1 Tax=Thalassophryne amazonica TaxID=390379 RepID=UPI0014716A08|nr:methenyltetrahydrofolate synthase domain-containing protein isoform X1 [Thalassophryne amazonica]